MRVTATRMLLLLVILLSAGLASLWVDAQGRLRHAIWQAPLAKTPDLQVPASLKFITSNAAAVSYTSIQERPLFAPDRRLPPPPAPPPPPDPLADIHIVGVVSGSSPGILARVESKTHRIKVNETLGVWTLKTIDGRDVTFVKGDETRRLKLDYAPLGTKSAAAIPVSAASAAGQSPVNQQLSGNGGAAIQNAQDAARDNIRRRNEIRAARGLPLITQ